MSDVKTVIVMIDVKTVMIVMSDVKTVMIVKTVIVMSV